MSSFPAAVRGPVRVVRWHHAAGRGSSAGAVRPDGADRFRSGRFALLVLFRGVFVFVFVGHSRFDFVALVRELFRKRPQ